MVRADSGSDGRRQRARQIGRPESVLHRNRRGADGNGVRAQAADNDFALGDGLGHGVLAHRGIDGAQEQALGGDKIAPQDD